MLSEYDVALFLIKILKERTPKVLSEKFKLDSVNEREKFYWKIYPQAGPLS